MRLSKEDLFREILEYLPTTSSGLVLGKMGTGKTTFVKLFAEYIREYYRREHNVETAIMVFSGEDVFNLTEVEETLRYDSSAVNVIILDDMSFILQSRTREVRALFNILTRVRHITESDYNYIFVVAHYSRSIAPFARGANLIVLTSISHPEIEGLKELFTLSSLYDYLEYVETHPRRYIYLIRYGVKELIVDFTLPNLPKPRFKERGKVKPIEVERDRCLYFDNGEKKCV